MRLFCPHGGDGGNGFLHGRSAHAQRTEGVLCPVLHSPGEPEDLFSGRHLLSGPGVDGTDGGNVTMNETGFLIEKRYLLHDRDSKYCLSFRQLIEAENVKALALPPQSPNLNPYSERWVRSVKKECLSQVDPVWGALAQARSASLPDALSSGTESSKQRQLAALSFL